MSRARSNIYSTYISLWEGFFIVGLLDLGVPRWVVAAVAIAVVVVGAWLFNRYRRHSVPDLVVG